MHESRETRVAETCPSDTVLGASGVILGRLRVG